MQLGMHLSELWWHKFGLAIAVLLATLAASAFLFRVSLSPLGLETKSLDVSSASTRLLVDTPQPAAIDLRQATYSLTELTNRALLLGNLMASLPVREYIARRTGVPPQAIRVSAPVTIDQPRPLVGEAQRPKSSDIFKSPHEYRISVQANPTVPVLDLYAEAPTTAAAIGLADGAVQGLHDYLRILARRYSTPNGARVRLTQLGPATGGRIGHGASVEFAILAFLVVFAASAATVLFVSRVHDGWIASEDLAGADPAPGQV